MPRHCQYFLDPWGVYAGLAFVVVKYTNTIKHRPYSHHVRQGRPPEVGQNAHAFWQVPGAGTDRPAGTLSSVVFQQRLSGRQAGATHAACAGNQDQWSGISHRTHEEAAHGALNAGLQTAVHAVSLPSAPWLGDVERQSALCWGIAADAACTGAYRSEHAGSGAPAPSRAGGYVSRGGKLAFPSHVQKGRVVSVAGHQGHCTGFHPLRRSAGLAALVLAAADDGYTRVVFYKSPAGAKPAGSGQGRGARHHRPAPSGNCQHADTRFAAGWRLDV